jgi:hypothetical protein
MPRGAAEPDYPLIPCYICLSCYTISAACCCPPNEVCETSIILESMYRQVSASNIQAHSSRVHDKCDDESAKEFLFPVAIHSA